jgi:hypothetical protein
MARDSAKATKGASADTMIRSLAAAATALACAGAAHAAQRVSLPSPLAPLSAQPPLAGGARSSPENAEQSVSASTNVAVSIDRAGTPFAVTAVQRLDVRGIGDYFFTIGAPVLTVRAPTNADSHPGMRTGSIIWAGFNPGRRLLVARATLEPAKVAAVLPLRVRVSGDNVTLENATRVAVDARERITVVAPLHVTGTIGRRRIDVVLTHRTRIHGSGQIVLRAEPVEQVAAVTRAGGRALLRKSIRATLTLARANQYEEFLGNPDPAGSSRTVYAYRTASPPHAAPIAAVGGQRHTWVDTALVVAALSAALVAGAALWARS